MTPTHHQPTPAQKQALKTVLVGAGALKRTSTANPTDTSIADAERALLLQSTCATVVPKLVPHDLPVFRSLLQGVFPGADVTSVEEAELRAAIAAACERRQLVKGDRSVSVWWMDHGHLLAWRDASLTQSPFSFSRLSHTYTSRWVDKLLQLHQVLALRHGVMLVGPTASGKTAAWRVLLEALAATHNVKVRACVWIDLGHWSLSLLSAPRIDFT